MTLSVYTESLKTGKNRNEKIFRSTKQNVFGREYLLKKVKTEDSITSNGLCVVSKFLAIEVKSVKQYVEVFYTWRETSPASHVAKQNRIDFEALYSGLLNLVGTSESPRM